MIDLVVQLLKSINQSWVKLAKVAVCLFRSIWADLGRCGPICSDLGQERCVYSNVPVGSTRSG